jgi:hypothetical protein
MEKSGELHAPAALSLGEALVLVEREAGWAPETVRQVWENSLSPAHAGTATRTAPSETIKRLTLRLLISHIHICIYGAPILDVSRSHTTTHHSR